MIIDTDGVVWLPDRHKRVIREKEARADGDEVEGRLKRSAGDSNLPASGLLVDQPKQLHLRLAARAGAATKVLAVGHHVARYDAANRTRNGCPPRNGIPHVAAQGSYFQAVIHGCGVAVASQ